jgi:hypothetical protein
VPKSRNDRNRVIQILHRERRVRCTPITVLDAENPVAPTGDRTPLAQSTVVLVPSCNGDGVHKVRNGSRVDGRVVKRKTPADHDSIRLDGTRAPLPRVDGYRVADSLDGRGYRGTLESVVLTSNDAPAEEIAIGS